MRYYLIQCTTNILAIHKIYDAALATFQSLTQGHDTYMELVQITTDEFGKVTEELTLQSYAKDTGTIMHMLRIHAPT